MNEPERVRRVDPRSAAARVVERVLFDGAFAAAALDAELSRARDLDTAGRALTTELVYGTLRTRRLLEGRILELAPRGLGKDRVLTAVLLVAAYQLVVLERAPAVVAVDQAVGSLRRARGERVAGFANAVLRRVATGQKVPPDRAALASAEAWLLERLTRDVGVTEAEALLGSGADLGVSVRTRLGGDVPAWLAEGRVGRVSHLARHVERGGDLRQRPGYADGRFVIQEEGSQVVALALGARAGDRVLDACAGRGQKTTLLREQLGADGEIWATDLHPSKLFALDGEVARLGLGTVRTLAVDWTIGVAGVPEGFDRVLVDAPCSGVGTLRRRPEIALRLGPADPARLAVLSERLLRAATTRARVGGRVVFAVCSVLREECEEVAARVSDVLTPLPFDAPEVVRVFGADATSFKLGPSAHGTEGYFVASFARRA